MFMWPFGPLCEGKLKVGSLRRSESVQGLFEAHKGVVCRYQVYKAYVRSPMVNSLPFLVLHKYIM